VLFSGEAGKRRLWGSAQGVPAKPICICDANALISISKLTFDVGVKITQTRFQYDRGINYLFALSVEDCINGVVNTASRRLNQAHTEIAATSSGPQPSSPPVLQNGSIMRMWVKDFFPFEEVLSLKKGEPLDEAAKPDSSA
jgi:hypothetical protein